MSSARDHSNDPTLLLRPARPDDVAGITALLDAASQRWVHRATSIEQVRDRINTPDTDGSRDTVVAVDTDRALVGFGHLWPAPTDEVRCFARTHPDHCGRGVGTALQRHLIARAVKMAGDRQLGRPVLTTTSWPGDADGEALLAHVGYAPARYFLKMVRDLADLGDDPSPVPTGLTIRGFAAGDEDAVFGAYADSFAEHWGQQDPDPTSWWHERRDADAAGYDPSLWLVALDGTELAGFVIAKIQHDSGGREHGYIGDLGVRTPWRGRGLASALLTRSFDVLRARGLPDVSLDVDAENTAGAVRLYSAVGMEQRPNFTIWSRALRLG
jgi:mycothiol synthase